MFIFEGLLNLKGGLTSVSLFFLFIIFFIKYFSYLYDSIIFKRQFL